MAINGRLCIFSALSLALALGALGTLIGVGAQITKDLSLLDGLATPPAPCGIATPNLEDLAGATTLRGTDGWAAEFFPPTAESESKALITDLCESVPADGVDGAVARMYNDKFNGTDALLQEHVCDRRSGDGPADPLRRITRAYLRSATAFARFSGRTADCVWTGSTYPFDSATCTNAAFVHDQLMQAVRDPVVWGREGQMPAVNVALYRLTALAILAHRDRQDNGGKCFKNGDGLTVDALCDRVFNAVSPPSPPPGANIASPPPPGLPLGGADYAFDAWDEDALLPTCDRPNLTTGTPNPFLSPPNPPPPQPPSSPAVGFADEADATMTVEKRQCVRQHTLALHDITYLYGLPDFNRAPDLETPRGLLPVQFVYDLFYKGYLKSWFYENRKNEALSSPEREVMVFSAFRVAMNLFWYLWAISCTIFWLAYGSVPLAVMSLQILRGATGGTMKAPEITRPPLAAGTFIAFFTSFLYVLWVLFVHPYPAPAVPKLDGDCSDFDETGAVYSSTRGWRLAAMIVALLLLLLLALGTVYILALRKSKPEPVRRAGQALQLLAIALALALLIVEAMVLSDSMDEWMTQVRDVADPWSQLAGARALVQKDLQVLIASTAGTAGGVAGLLQRYVLNNTNTMVRGIWAFGVVLVMWIGRLTKLSVHGDGYDDAFASGQRAALNSGALAIEVALTLVAALIAFNLMKLKARLSRAATRARDSARRFRRRSEDREPSRAAPMLASARWIPVAQPLSDDERVPFARAADVVPLIALKR